MSKLESSYVTIGTTRPNATDQITMASPNRLLWQVWATGSPGYSSWVCFSSYPQGALVHCKHLYLKPLEKYLEFIQIYLERTEGQQKYLRYFSNYVELVCLRESWAQITSKKVEGRGAWVDYLSNLDT